MNHYRRSQLDFFSLLSRLQPHSTYQNAKLGTIVPMVQVQQKFMGLQKLTCFFFPIWVECQSYQSCNMLRSWTHSQWQLLRFEENRTKQNIHFFFIAVFFTSNKQKLGIYRPCQLNVTFHLSILSLTSSYSNSTEQAFYC